MAKTNELIVHVIANPAPKIKWIKDNKELIIKDRNKVETKQLIDGDENLKEYKFIIENVQPNDGGKYKIEVSNKCGTESSQTDIIVKGINFFNDFILLHFITMHLIKFFFY